MNIDSVSFKNWINEFLTTVFENVIEFSDDTHMAKCLKGSLLSDFIPSGRIRVSGEDLISFLSERITFADPETDLISFLDISGDEMKQSAFTLSVNGKDEPFIGAAVASFGSLYFGFSNMKSSERIMNKKSDENEKQYRIPYAGEGHRVFIRTFGFFDVYVDGKAVYFPCKKAKELLAFLVDRRGGYVSSAEAAAALWPDEDPGKALLSRLRKTAERLKKILEENGIINIVESINGKRRVIPEAFECDLFSMLKNGGSTRFPGTYMKNYLWKNDTRQLLLSLNKSSNGRRVI